MARAKVSRTVSYDVGTQSNVTLKILLRKEDNGTQTYILDLKEFIPYIPDVKRTLDVISRDINDINDLLELHIKKNTIEIVGLSKSSDATAILNVIVKDLVEPLTKINAASTPPSSTIGVSTMSGSSGSSFIPAPKNPVTPVDPYNDVTMGMDDLEPYYVLPKTAIQIYSNKKVKDCYTFFVSVKHMGEIEWGQRFNRWLNTKVFSNVVKIDTYPTVMGDVKSYRYDFFFEVKNGGEKFITSSPSLDIQELTFKLIDDILIEKFGIPDFSSITGGQSAAPSPVKDAVAASSYDTIYEAELESTKKEVEQLIVMRSLVSPIDFEEKLIFNQSIAAAQKKINDLNFKITEAKLQDDNIFDDLFEQAFTPIKNTYSEIYASSGSFENPQSSNFFTPNGMPSKLSDKVNMMIRTPQFNEWFGNWQSAYNYKYMPDEISCSTVITKDFEPLLVWHGTGTEFSYFRFDNFPAAYFAVTKAYSEWFADLHGGGEGYTIPFFLNIRNPLDLSMFKTTKIKSKEFFDYIYLMTGMDMQELEVNPLFMDSSSPAVETWVYLRNNASMLKKIADSHVFDGIHFYETNPSVPEGQAAHVTEAFIIFNPNQCKIADPDRGKYLFGSLKSFLLKHGGKL
ncbi:MAG: hypothetical protein QG594_125 [Bacteroidota bacterium]|nr:hypothetical protein [Bacteroidota bacterium]